MLTSVAPMESVSARPCVGRSSALGETSSRPAFLPQLVQPNPALSVRGMRTALRDSASNASAESHAVVTHSAVALSVVSRDLMMRAALFGCVCPKMAET